MLTVGQRMVVTAIAEALLYGIYLATVIRCLRWLIFADEDWKLREKITSITMVFATLFIFLTSTTNLITSLQILLGFLRKDKGWYMSEIGMANNISWLLSLLFIDGVLIYRCWMVYVQSWRAICVPIIFWLGLLACSALSFYYQRQNFKGQHRHQIEAESITVGYVCNIATTIYTTTAIIYRIWRTTKASGRRPKRLKYIMRILAESGILYTSISALSLVGSVLTIQNPTWVENLIFDFSSVISFSMAGIALNLLLIRVNQGRIELPDSQVDSKNVDEERNLSELRFKNSKVAASSEGPSSNQLDEENYEIQELRRNSDGMQEN